MSRLRRAYCAVACASDLPVRHEKSPERRAGQLTSVHVTLKTASACVQTAER